jgi:hypothetical protein
MKNKFSFYFIGIIFSGFVSAQPITGIGELKIGMSEVDFLALPDMKSRKILDAAEQSYKNSDDIIYRTTIASKVGDKVYLPDVAMYKLKLPIGVPETLSKKDFYDVRVVIYQNKIVDIFVYITLGIEAAIVAVALGARVIEKHFTLDKGRTTFRDHALSADPRDFKRLSEIMRISEAMIGTGSRTEVMDDIATRIAARRSIVCARDLPAGAELCADAITLTRPGDGIAPVELLVTNGRAFGEELPCCAVPIFHAILLHPLAHEHRLAQRNEIEGHRLFEIHLQLSRGISGIGCPVSMRIAIHRFCCFVTLA